MTMDAGLAAEGVLAKEPGNKWVRLILDHNPCFLLSAVLMFWGVFLLNAARDAHAAEMGKLLGVLAAVNVYEFAVIAIALLLLRRMGMVKSTRDPFLLLLIQLLFLTDGGFLINEAVQTSPHWGWVVNVILFLLGMAKASLAMAGLAIPLRWRTLGFLAVQLGMMFGLPIVFSCVAKDGEVSGNAMYWAWWAVGILPAVYDAVAGSGRMELSGRQQFLRRSYVIVPWLLLVAHLGFYHYVYEAPFVAADLSPMLLGLAVATRRVPATKLLPAGHLRFFRWGLPVVAVLLAFGAPAEMALTYLGHHGTLTVLVTVEAVMVVYGYFISWGYAGRAAAAVVLLEISRALWPMTKEVVRQGADNGDRMVRSMWHWLPTTTAGWGVAAMVAAFVMLGVGAIFSLRGGKGVKIN